MRIPPYDSFDPQCKTPFGAVPSGSDVRFCVRLSTFLLPRGCTLLLFKADEFDNPQRYEMGLGGALPDCNLFSCTLPLPDVPQLYFYCFEVALPEGPRQIRRTDSHNGDFSADGALWQITAYARGYRTPAPPSRGIVYQIFPDRFCASGIPKKNVPDDRWLHGEWGELPEYRPNQNGEVTNADYFGGDLRGIEQKLDYLHELGVSLLYLNPIFEAHSNHRYNVADYFKVDPLLGTNEDFRHLCAEAKKRGIGIVLDGVFSHTGSDSVYFNKLRRYGDGGAYNDPDSPYRTWYKFTEYPEKYHSWWGFDTLPEIIEETPGFLDFICGERGVIRYWMSLGAKGFRLDVADELPDVILDRLRRAVKEQDPEGLLIGEVWEDASNKIAYSQRRRYLLGEQLDGVMNYPFMNAVLRYVRYGDSDGLYHGLLTILENYPAPSARCLFNSLSTHDTARAITMLAGDEYTGGDRYWQADHHELAPQQYERGRALLLIAYTLLYFLPGLPCLYYGDEAGNHGWRDPFNRCTYPWGREDTLLLRAFKLLGRLYRDNAFLSGAAFQPLVSTGQVFIYRRVRDGHSLTVAVNRSEEGQPVSAILGAGEYHVVAGSFAGGVLGPLSAVVEVQHRHTQDSPAWGPAAH